MSTQLEAVLAELNDDELRLQDRLRRRPHGHHHGSLRSQLDDGRKGLAHARPGRGPSVCLPPRKRSKPTALRTWHDRSGSAAVRHRRRMASPVGTDRKMATASSSSTSAATVRMEISQAFDRTDFDQFDRGDYPERAVYAGMLEYDGDLQIPKHYLVKPPVHHQHADRSTLRKARRSRSTPSPRRRNSATSPTSGTATAPARSTRTWRIYAEIPSDVVPFEQAPADEVPRRSPTSWSKPWQSGKYQFLRCNLPERRHGRPHRRSGAPSSPPWRPSTRRWPA